MSGPYQPLGRTGADVGPDLGASADPRTNPYRPRCGGLLPCIDPVMVAFVATASFRALCAGGMDRYIGGMVRPVPPLDQEGAASTGTDGNGRRGSTQASFQVVPCFSARTLLYPNATARPPDGHRERSGDDLPPSVQHLYIPGMEAHFMHASTPLRPVWWEERTLGVVTLIAVLTALVFYLDLITPLGLTVWILYFIPLYLTFSIRWSPAPFAATAVFVALIGATSVLSYRDVSLLYALLNRVFFTGMLVVLALFIWNARRSLDRLQVSEERHRHLAESSPDSILVSSGERIIYANPAGEQMFAAGREDGLVGRPIVDLVNPAEREEMCGHVRQTLHGARMHVPAVRMNRLDGRSLCADASLNEIVWDGEPAVQIVIRPAGRRAHWA